MDKETTEKLGKLAYEYGFPSIFYVAAVGFLLSGENGKAILSLFMPYSLGVLHRFIKKLDPSIDRLLSWIVGNLENASTQMWWLLTSKFQQKYYRRITQKYRDYRIQGRTKGPFPLDLEKVFVSLKVSPESSSRISSDMLYRNRKKEDYHIWDFLTESKGESLRRIAILGPPGSGKSTLLEHIALIYSRNRHRTHSKNALTLIPILLYLRDIRESVSQPSAPNLPTLLGQQDGLADLNLNNWFLNKLNKGNCLVMLDGLDEVSSAGQRIRVSEWVREQIRSFPNSHFIITSRPFGYKNMPLDGISVTLEVQPFTLSQMNRFIHQWYLQSELTRHREKENESIHKAATNQSNELIKRIVTQPVLSKLALNPLLLTMIATVHRYRGALPGKRIELYDEICDVLLGRRQGAKHISDSLTALQKRTVLQHLALQLMLRNTTGFNLSTGISIVEDKLYSITDQMSALDFLRNMEEKSGLIVERERDLYEFAHKSFQEYLAASEIKSLRQSELLVEMIGNVWWSETIRLYSAQSDATPFIQVALNSNSIDILSLAFDCLEEGLIVHPNIREKFEKRLLNGLTSLNEEEFQLAAKTRLKRRFNQFLRIDEKTAIDTTYITCAEYQLFINDKYRQEGKVYRPDHWNNNRFLQNTATRPILGVRAEDAVEFCKWLSKQEGKQYRLPFSEESELNETFRNDLGRWVMTSDSIILLFSKGNDEQLYHWSEKIKDFLLNDFPKDFDNFLSRKIARSEAEYQQVLKHSVTRLRKYPVSLSCIRSFTRDSALAYNIDIGRTLDIAKKFSLERDKLRSSQAEQEERCESSNIQALEEVLKLETANQKSLRKEFREATFSVATIEFERKQQGSLPASLSSTAAENTTLKEARRRGEEAYSQLHQLGERIRKIEKELERARNHHTQRIHSRKSKLEKSRITELFHELDFASKLAIDLSINRSISNKLDIALERVSNIDEVCGYISIYIAFWDILSRFYEQHDYNQKRSIFGRSISSEFQMQKEESIKNLEKVIKIYHFFEIVRLRQLENIPSWEGIQIVLQEPQ